MNTIQQIFFALLLIITISLGCSTNPTTGLSLTASIGGMGLIDTTQIVYISLTLQNESPDTLKFMSMNCSYQDMFYVEGNEDYKVRSRYDCFSNVPFTLVLPPQAKTDRYIMIEPIDKGQSARKEKLRFATQYIEPNSSEFDDMSDFYHKRYVIGEQILSNEIELDRLYKSIYYD